MSSASSEDDDDASASMMSTSELNGSSSANSSRKRKSKSGSYFRVWGFQLIVKADLRHSNTTEGKGTLLTEHLRTRTGHSRPSCVTSLTVFCDELQFSGPSDSDDLISIQCVWKRHGKQRGTRGRQASPKGRLPDRKLSSFEFLSINICLEYKGLTDRRHTGGA